MCVAIFKPANKTIDRETLRACFLAYPHGAGFAWFDGKQIHLRKGYFSFADWANDIAQIPASAPALLHARITTHGKTCPENCHPFIVTANPKLLEAVTSEIKNGCVAIHNGIIEGMTAQNSIDILHSDTMQFIAQILAPLARKIDITNGTGQKIVAKLTAGSRFAVMATTGKITLFGKWHEHNGAYFSNMVWQPRKSTWHDYSQIEIW